LGFLDGLFDGQARKAKQAAARRKAVYANPPPISDKVSEAFSQAMRGEAAGIEDLRALANAGDMQAAMHLGQALGWSSKPEDLAEAHRYLERASKSLLSALLMRGVFYSDGVGVPPDPARAASIYAEAAEAGDPLAKCFLGRKYVAGDGVPQDPARGLKLLTEAAQAGNGQALIEIGKLYLEGKAVPQDYNKARLSFEPAAKRQFREALYQMGLIYANQLGVERDLDKARDYMLRAYKPILYRPAVIWLADDALARAEAGADLDVALLDEALDWYEKAGSEALSDMPESNQRYARAKSLKHGAP